MNDRIKELAEQAGYTPLPGFDFANDLQEVFLNKFAELIVRECAEACMKEIDIGSMMAPKSPWMAKQILEHFGIEE